MKDLLLHKYRFYTLTFTGLLVWMLFFDVNDVWTQIKMYRELGRLEDEKKYYVQKIKEVEKERIEVMGNKKLVEKFAREKYLMKKPQEEIFHGRIFLPISYFPSPRFALFLLLLFSGYNIFSHPPNAPIHGTF